MQDVKQASDLSNYENLFPCSIAQFWYNYLDNYGILIRSVVDQFPTINILNFNAFSGGSISKMWWIRNCKGSLVNCNEHLPRTSSLSRSNMSEQFFRVKHSTRSRFCRTPFLGLYSSNSTRFKLKYIFFLIHLFMNQFW